MMQLSFIGPRLQQRYVNLRSNTDNFSNSHLSMLSSGKIQIVRL